MPLSPRRILGVVGAAALAAVLVTAPILAPGGSAARAAVGSDGRLAVAVVLPVVVPPATGGLLTASELEAYTAADGILTRDLDAVVGQQVALAVDPRIIASIRVLGDTAPPSSRQWLARLAELPNESFPLAYADADPVGPGQAGTAQQLAPLGFSDAIDPAHFAAAADPTASPTPTENPSERPALPTDTDDVLSWTWSITGIVWPAAGTLVGADLPRLAAQGYTTVLADSENLQGGAAGRVSFSAAPTMSGLVTDADLGDALQQAAGAQSDEGFQTALGRLDSELAGAAAEPGSSERVVALGRSALRSVDRLAAALAAVTARADTRTASLGEVRSSTASAASVVDMPEDAERLSAISSSIAEEQQDTAFSVVAVDPSDVTAPRRRALLALLSVEWIGNSQFSTWVGDYRRESQKLRSSVELVSSTDAFTLGADPPLPVSVRNGLSFPVRVFASARPRQQVLVVPASAQRVEVTVPADSTQTARIRSQSVKNGSVRVIFSLESSTGQQIGASRERTITVQAGWETAGTLIVVVLVLGVFGFGIVRRIQQGRRDRRREAVGTAGTANDGTGDTRADTRADTDRTARG